MQYCGLPTEISVNISKRLDIVFTNNIILFFFGKRFGQLIKSKTFFHHYYLFYARIRTWKYIITQLGVFNRKSTVQTY